MDKLYAVYFSKPRYMQDKLALISKIVPIFWRRKHAIQWAKKYGLLDYIIKKVKIEVEE